MCEFPFPDFLVGTEARYAEDAGQHTNIYYINPVADVMEPRELIKCVLALPLSLVLQQVHKDISDAIIVFNKWTYFPWIDIRI